jgi:hypothetical protein
MSKKRGSRVQAARPQSATRYRTAPTAAAVASREVPSTVVVEMAAHLQHSPLLDEAKRATVDEGNSGSDIGPLLELQRISLSDRSNESDGEGAYTPQMLPEGTLQIGERATCLQIGFFGVYYQYFLVGLYYSVQPLMYPVFNQLLGMESYKVKGAYQVCVAPSYARCVELGSGACEFLSAPASV